MLGWASWLLYWYAVLQDLLSISTVKSDVLRTPKFPSWLDSKISQYLSLMVMKPLSSSGPLMLKCSKSLHKGNVKFLQQELADIGFGGSRAFEIWNTFPLCH